MPRPGPRPYECVRRAWHSDSHQPMRGSLIQEIFRVVDEIHSPITKKNKEWQEKLPIVVLKAEEIMYSKANSEAEYRDLKTLWDRTNDAINTIIRKDDSTETGDLLQPCIEAALNLGCIPRRASRSQRHNTPRYLTPQDSCETPSGPKVPEHTTYSVHCPLLPIQPTNPTPKPSAQFSPYYSTLVTPPPVNSTCPASEPSPLEKIGSPSVPCRELPSLSEKHVHRSQDGYSGPLEIYAGRTLGQAYPLHYGANRTSHLQIVSEQKTRMLHSLMDHNYAQDASNTPPNFVGTCEDRGNDGFDLSLRLGPMAAPSSSLEHQWTREVGEMGSRFHDRSRLCDLSLSTRTREIEASLSSHRRDNALSLSMDDHLLKASSSRWGSVRDDLNPEAVRKRKVPTNSTGEDLRIHWQAGKFFDRTRGGKP
ncbi:hypothetical protein H6P81_000286 [Aristolochia fimbriata]|uniref:Histone acetyltransferase n=1 Tax=Aristolochia fimbriata TaxID=158543 RepID=A0AAV7F875_ARIFI|nr:hypothetical protein H6P81_000286 [Aristolochia fimbriata]